MGQSVLCWPGEVGAVVMCHLQLSAVCFRYKHLMLTRSELAEVQRINEKAGLLQIQGLDQVDK